MSLHEFWMLCQQISKVRAEHTDFGFDEHSRLLGCVVMCLVMCLVMCVIMLTIMCVVMRAVMCAGNELQRDEPSLLFSTSPFLLKLFSSPNFASLRGRPSAY